MENDVLKNKIEPWQEKGRWYHGEINLTTHTFTVNTDKFLKDNFNYVEASGRVVYYTINPNISIIDVKAKVKNIVSSATSIYPSWERYFTQAGRNGFTVGLSATMTGTCEIWVFID